MQPIRYRLNPKDFDTVPILRKLGSASRAVAELKGMGASIPRPGILINTLVMQEAKDSSAIENIVATHDELFKDEAFAEEVGNAAAREVLRYRKALKEGYGQVRRSGLLTNNHIVHIQQELERNTAGFRKLPGTTLQDGTGSVIYTPPQDPKEIITLMADLESVINDESALPVDPLAKMAVIHHQFESIHPFYDGNGRTGRIINVLILGEGGAARHSDPLSQQADRET